MCTPPETSLILGRRATAQNKNSVNLRRSDTLWCSTDGYCLNMGSPRAQKPCPCPPCNSSQCQTVQNRPASADMVHGHNAIGTPAAQKTKGSHVLEGGKGGGGRFGWDPPPMAPVRSPPKQAENLSLNPLGARVAKANFWLSASNIERGGEGGDWQGWI